jgi:hypothetical protein
MIGAAAYERQLQCAACGRWRSFVEYCPLCGMRGYIAERIALSPGVTLAPLSSLGVHSASLGRLRAAFRELVEASYSLPVQVSA